MISGRLDEVEVDTPLCHFILGRIAMLIIYYLRVFISYLIYSIM